MFHPYLSHAFYLRLQSPTILHMLLDLKAHTLKVENALKKKQTDSILDMPEFKACVPFLRRATISN